MTTQGPVTRDTVCAGFGERFVATLIDIAVLLIPNIIFYVLFDDVITNVLSFILSAAYSIYFWTSTGSTPGKSVMGLKVVNADGGALLTPSGALIRWIAQIPSGLFLALGYLWVIWDSKHEAWHDKLATTKVIKFK